jgi:predicted MPP superfamily phosphohydrolase
MAVSRRRFIRAALTAAIGAGTTGLYTWRVEPHWLEFTHRVLPIRGLPEGLQGRTLVLISDLHVGPQVDIEYLLDAFRKTKALQPDIVAFAGDFITFKNRIFPGAQLERLFTEVPRGALGTVGILGNHDYGMRWSQAAIANRVEGIVSSAGVTVLRNQVTAVTGLQFAGVDDLWTGHFDLVRTLQQVEPNRPVIAMAHNPDCADQAGWGSFEGWILSGHTHGGQCKPPFLPPPLLPVKNRRYTSGAFALSGKRSMYISRGVGHLLQVRFNVRPEITVFRLVGGTETLLV